MWPMPEPPDYERQPPRPQSLWLLVARLYALAAVVAAALFGVLTVFGVF